MRAFQKPAQKPAIGYWNPKTETMPREQLQTLQLRKLQAMVRWAYDNSKLWQRKFDQVGLEPQDIRSLDDIQLIPFLTKEEFLNAQTSSPPFGDTLAAPSELAVRYHQTSGTSSRVPLRALDGRKDWEWQSEMWAYGLYAFGVRPKDICYLPVGYNVFIGFWGVHYGAEKIGAMVIPGGAQSSESRLKQIVELGATVVATTPTYALRLAQYAEDLGMDLAHDSKVEMLVLTSEPGANIPSTKRMLEEMWGARVGDFVGMTEAGTIVAYECSEQCGAAHIIEDHYYEEVIDPRTLKPLGYGQKGERVMTSFGRGMMPVLRFRTGDLVEKVEASYCSCGRTFDLYKGGVLGRTDDMKLIRGTNVYPGAVENIVREYKEISEFQIVLTREGYSDEITVQIEPRSDVPEERLDFLSLDVASDLAEAHEGLRFNVVIAEPGTLPKFEVTSVRLQDLRI
ncbi:MAG: phenylacetate--CoA ligase family protein [Chloroflexi bacterium]|nr:phenylacetate--CoA ligase family protein [Chloroflexota bacterium]